MDKYYYGEYGKFDESYLNYRRFFELSSDLYTPEYVLSLVDDENRSKILVDDKYVKKNSKRYYVFKNSLACSNCGIEGKFFTLERNSLEDSIWHFNLYAVDDNGCAVLMTKNHIIPRSKGGSGKLENLCTMCFRCNNLIFKYRSDLNECEMPRPVGRNRPV